MIRTLLSAGALVLALSLPALADDACPDKWRTIADDQAVALAHGFLRHRHRRSTEMRTPGSWNFPA